MAQRTDDVILSVILSGSARDFLERRSVIGTKTTKPQNGDKSNKVDTIFIVSDKV